MFKGYFMRFVTLCAALLAATITAPAFAQTADPATDAVAGPSVFDGDNATVGIGAAYLPSYEGSDDYLVTLAPFVRGSVGGIDFETRGTGLAVDVIPSDGPFNLLLGPEVRVNLDRTRRIKDPVVRALGERDVAIEGGGFAGFAYSGALNPYDTVTARVDVLTDLGNEHGGTTITPALSYATPLSTALYVVASVEATHASDGYTDAFFSITPAGSLASGLPSYSAQGGWKNWAVTLATNYDLSGDLRDGGLGLFVGGSYSRLLNDAADSPIVSLRGDRDQWFAAGGLTFTF
jgi:MipA family protein